MHIDQGDYVCSLFIDMWKAFDTVDHKMLIQKLNYYGICGICKKWLVSYLANHQQSESFQLNPLMPGSC